MRTSERVMRFAAFRDTLSSTALKNIASHWNEARAGRQMPSWGDISPARISAHLSIVWSYKFDLATVVFTGRLAGDRIEQVYGKSVRGATLREIFPCQTYPWARTLLDRVVKEPALHRGHGPVFRGFDRYGLGERIVLPLADDGVIADGVLGATEYRYTHPLPGVPIETVAETEQWFSLK